jgi:tetratricopeptide (TPR) repeat protein
VTDRSAPPPADSDRTLDAPATPRPIDPPQSSAGEGPGAVIGRYTLIEEIGAGGFGAVFRAEQRVPVARQVALKILKLGMDTRQVIARFEQERQALALMDHPHIAKVLDAGATDAGRPYFVMELVDGEPITGFCDAHDLTLRERLELFLQVTNAIQHAHQKGVIHRDIKPSNVLVSVHDGTPHAKVIDFGIAKAIEQPIVGETMHTHLGQFIGTPLYMSPEQSEGRLDVDTRSDVYSLGVVLYELLTAATPFDAATFERNSRAEIERLIREVDPPRPSARVSSSARALPELAARRSTEPRKLTSLLRGELDWIAMKALEKDPERRYQTANALALDVQRYLAGEPVAAAPPGAAYRLRKFVARHRGPVIAAAIVGLALVGGLAGTLWQARVASRQRDAARQQAARATALNDFMSQMLTATDPEERGSRDVTVLELLAKASETAGKTLAGEPAAEAEARTLLGNTFRSLGKIEPAIAELERAVTLRATAVPSDPLGRARSLKSLAVALSDRGDYQAALPLLERARDLLAGLGGAQVEELAAIHYSLGLTESRLSRYADAERDLDRSDALLDRLLEERPGTRSLILTARASLARDWKGDLALAETLYGAALDQSRSAGEPWLIASALNALAVSEAARDKLDDASAHFREAIDVVSSVFGDDHPTLASYLENLGGLHLQRQEYDQTLALLERVLAIRESVYGADSFPAARTRFNMGVVASESGDSRRGLELIDAALVVFREHSGERSLETATALIYRGRCLEWTGNLAAAERDYESALAIQDAIGVPAHELRLNALMNLARVRCMLGGSDRATGAFDLALSALEPQNSDHQKWFSLFESVRANCRRAP